MLTDKLKPDEKESSIFCLDQITGGHNLINFLETMISLCDEGYGIVGIKTKELHGKDGEIYENRRRNKIQFVLRKTQ
jgi:hypothetical protein